MSIAIKLFDTFDIETRDGLIAYVISHLELDTETAAQVPTFIRKAEYRLDRLLTIPHRESSVSLSFTAGTDRVSLPADCRSVRSVYTDRPLKQVALSYLQDRYDEAGMPLAYALSEHDLVLGPVPASTTSVRLSYLTRLEPLTDANQTNWLLSNNADVYVYATLWQAAAWLEDIDAATAFRAEMMTIIDEINLQAQRARWSGPLVPAPGYVA